MQYLYLLSTPPLCILPRSIYSQQVLRRVLYTVFLNAGSSDDQLPPYSHAEKPPYIIADALRMHAVSRSLRFFSLPELQWSLTSMLRKRRYPGI